MTDTDDKRRKFASWKLSWIDAMMVGLAPREFRVAVCLLQFANKENKLIFPSQARMAALLGASVSSVERAIAAMVSAGWLEKRRQNRHLPNSYRFVESMRDAMADLRTQRTDDYKAERWGRPDPDPAEVTGPDLDDPAEVTGLDPANLKGPDPAEVTGKHLYGSPSLKAPPTTGAVTSVNVV